MNKSKTQKVHKTRSKFTPADKKWLTVAKAEFWLYVASIALILFIPLLALLISTNPGMGIVIGAILLIILAPFMLAALVFCVINLLMLHKSQTWDNANRITLLKPLSFVAVMSVGLVLGSARYVLIFTIAALIYWLVLKNLFKRKSPTSKQLDTLTTIATILSILSLILFVGIKLCRYFYSIIPQFSVITEHSNNAQDAENSYQDQRQEIIDQLQPLIDDGISEELALMSYAYCQSPGEIFAIVDYGALFHCDAHGEVFDLQATGARTGDITVFGNSETFDGGLMLASRSSKDSNSYATFLLSASSENDLLDTYGEKLISYFNEEPHGPAMVKIFYIDAPINQVNELDLVSLATLSKNMPPIDEQTFKASIPTLDQIYTFTSVPESAVMQQITTHLLETTETTLGNRYIDLTISPHSTISLADLSEAFTGPLAY